MFNENLKTLRIQKGMSQEVLAERLHVVRQTISKWEKGLSVPDVEMLKQLADLLEVSVGDLLGAKIKRPEEVNEVAAQLALLNDYLAEKSQHRRKVWQGIGIAVVVILLIVLLSSILFTKI
jgi:transcriptional regulator with XRE-family HTH domain